MEKEISEKEAEIRVEVKRRGRGQELCFVQKVETTPPKGPRKIGRDAKNIGKSDRPILAILEDPREKTGASVPRVTASPLWPPSERQNKGCVRDAWERDVTPETLETGLFLWQTWEGKKGELYVKIVRKNEIAGH